MKFNLILMKTLQRICHPICHFFYCYFIFLPLQLDKGFIVVWFPRPINKFQSNFLFLFIIQFTHKVMLFFVTSYLFFLYQELSKPSKDKFKPRNRLTQFSKIVSGQILLINASSFVHTLNCNAILIIVSPFLTVYEFVYTSWKSS